MYFYKILYKINFLVFIIISNFYLTIQIKQNNLLNVCQTRECQTLGALVVSAMNRSVNPCDDFWEHTCGNWISQTPIPPFAAVWNRFSLLTLKMNERIRGILQSYIKKSDLNMLNKAKRWYRSCINTNGIEQDGISGLLSYVEYAGGWPITMENNEWSDKNILWQQIDLYYGKLTGSYSMYSVEPGKDYDNLLLYKILVTKAELPLSTKLPAKRRKIDEKEKKAYGKLIKNIAREFAEAKGVNINENNLQKDIKDMIDFEVKLSKIDLGNLYKTQMAGFSDDYYANFRESESANINFTECIKNIFESDNQIVSPKQSINIHYDYIFELGKLLRMTSVRTIANYVHWKFISELMEFTNLKMNNFLFEYKKETFGVKTNYPRWEQCVRSHPMKHAIAVEFVKKYFPEHTNNSANEMIKSIKQAMQQEITESNWMTTSTKAFVKTKLENIITLIGYPDWYKNEELLQQAYDELYVSSNYFDNAINFLQYAVKGIPRVLQFADKRDSWYSDPLTVNAFYRIFLNNINLPASTFQPPFFTPDGSEIGNYAMLGSITAHEFSHAFDSLGIQFDENGSYRRLAPKVLSAYLKNAQCFVNQYTKYYKTSGYKLANRTLNENIADNQGIRAAFSAFEKLPNHKEKILPGLENYTNEQTFFIMFSSLWCSKATPEFIERKSTDDEETHSDPRLRVIGTLSNFEDFSKAFNCPIGSRMNPVKKCNVWQSLDGNKI